MRVFLTGATGFIGSRLVPELLSAGHQVLGLTRSDRGATALAAIGAEPFRGDIDDLDGLAQGAARCEGVIHTAFDHDFSRYIENCERDRRAIAALGAALEGSDRPLVITSITAMGAVRPGVPATEDVYDGASHHPRAASEQAMEALAARGLNVSAVRLSQIHDTTAQGLVTPYIAHARAAGMAAYAGEGRNGWSAAHVGDTVRLFRLALERAEAGARYHATAETGIAFRDIAEAVGRRFALPARALAAEEAVGHFGWLAPFVAADMSASSALTAARLGWRPVGPGLLADIAGIA
ncbi:SDR family oxidoreductase [Acuticoccus kandeliae]|uniref:SDR family oxidoreductase n=1 Tax=Acuticoccus kandeliae TaxID=2073160 RepID=UPI000D3E9D8E|nr:SDR family oxidoreductase [Acuticoccus kandeliae]